MRTILVAVDGSAGSDSAVKHVIHMVSNGAGAEVHVLYAQQPIHENLTEIALGMMAGLQHSEAEKATASARELLSQAGVAHRVSVETGEPAETITKYAAAHGCGEIVMGTRGLGSIRSLIMGSGAMKVVHLASVPVTLVQ